MYLILRIRPVFNKAPPVFIRYIFHWRCLGKFTVSLAFKVSFPQVIPILSQSRLENMGASFSGCIILAIQLEPHLLKIMGSHYQQPRKYWTEQDNITSFHT